MTAARVAQPAPRPRLPLVLLGVGLGGFLDGIVLHQVLQWHHLISSYAPATELDALQRNTFWDGVFHLATWIVVVVAVVMLTGRRTRRMSRRELLAGLLVGWGLFNLADQVVFHLLLGAHHIRMVDNYVVYDLTYTVLGIVLIVAGLALQKRTAADPLPNR